MSITPLADIPSLSLLYKDHYLKAASSTALGAISRFNDQISLIRTDITKLGVDAIVNAANETLLGGGGVDGAIHRAAGPDLLRECETLGGCDTGSAKISNAYRLPCKKVIHAVGPVYHTTKRLGLHTTLLKSCYTTSLDLAAKNDCKSIAFSALSTGVYGYPSAEAAEAAIQAVKGWLEADEERAKNIERVIFCQFMQKDEEAYARFIPTYFPPTTSTTATTTSKRDDSFTENIASKSAASSEPADPAKNIAPATTAIGAEQGEVHVLDLPDVPTKEPALPGEPESKKPKLEEAKV